MSINYLCKQLYDDVHVTAYAVRNQTGRRIKNRIMIRKHVDTLLTGFGFGGIFKRDWLLLSLLKPYFRSKEEIAQGIDLS